MSTEDDPRKVRINGMVMVTLPQPFLDLQEELSRHPELVAKLQATGANTFHTAMAELAAELEVALDGSYTPEDLAKLCGILIVRLRFIRSGEVPTIGVIH